MPAITPAEFEVYARTARQRAAARRERLRERRERAWSLARQAAALLREAYDAQKVRAFGSLLQPRLFHERSDIDLAVWGLDERDYLRALSRLLDLDPEFSFDLVLAEVAPEGLRAVIDDQGEAL
jgi:predicted nucleotidyltransferase